MKTKSVNPSKPIKKRVQKTGIVIPSDYDYEQLLREVHPQFCKRLAQRAPTLTPTEIKHCMLARLHFHVKEAAKMLSISESAVETYRSRARTKLHLDRRQNLVSVLHGI